MSEPGEIVMFMGKRVEDMDRAELLEAVRILVRQVQTLHEHQEFIRRMTDMRRRIA